MSQTLDDEELERLIAAHPEIEDELRERKDLFDSIHEADPVLAADNIHEGAVGLLNVLHDEGATNAQLREVGGQLVLAVSLLAEIIKVNAPDRRLIVPSGELMN